jgi:hypothetical protein
MTQHTPGPWATLQELGTENPLYRGMIAIVGTTPEGEFIGVACADDERAYTTCNGETMKANAEFIVRACNAHYDLLTVCKSAYDQLLKDEMYAGDPLMAQLFAAIAKAEGEDA